MGHANNPLTLRHRTARLAHQTEFSPMDEEAVGRLVEQANTLHELSLGYLRSPEALFQLGTIFVAVAAPG